MTDHISVRLRLREAVMRLKSTLGWRAIFAKTKLR